MSVIRSALRTVFGTSFEIIDLEIAFHKNANLYGEHGRILASHRAENIDGQPVRFVFVGLSSPPPMTPRILEYIWEEARAQGFIPHAMITYGSVLQTTPDLTPNELVREALRNAQTGPFGAVGKSVPEKTQMQMSTSTFGAQISESTRLVPVDNNAITPEMVAYNEETERRIKASRAREEAEKPRPQPAGAKF